MSLSHDIARLRRGKACYAAKRRHIAHQRSRNTASPATSPARKTAPARSAPAATAAEATAASWPTRSTRPSRTYGSKIAAELRESPSAAGRSKLVELVEVELVERRLDTALAVAAAIVGHAGWRTYIHRPRAMPPTAERDGRSPSAPVDRRLAGRIARQRASARKPVKLVDVEQSPTAAGPRTMPTATRADRQHHERHRHRPAATRGRDGRPRAGTRPRPRRSGSRPGRCRRRSAPPVMIAHDEQHASRRGAVVRWHAALRQRRGCRRGSRPCSRSRTSSGRPARARAPHRKVQCVIGITFRRPPKRRMSMTLPIACMTLPAARNSSALKKAWVNRWNMPASRPAQRCRMPSAEEHVAELAEGRIGQHALEVVLRQGDQRGQAGR